MTFSVFWKKPTKNWSKESNGSALLRPHHWERRRSEREDVIAEIEARMEAAVAEQEALLAMTKATRRHCLKVLRWHLATKAETALAARREAVGREETTRVQRQTSLHLAVRMLPPQVKPPRCWPNSLSI